LTDTFIGKPDTAVATRTLLAGGFVIEGFQRQPTHIEYRCSRVDFFGVTVPYVVAIFELDAPKSEHLEPLKRSSAADGRVLAIVASAPGPAWLSWSEFLDSLGGAVPTWRALGIGYSEVLAVSSRNELPPGIKGEPWKVFEDAVGDGLEFVFGRRVLRLGSQLRGQRVGDQITQTPDAQVLLIDAKASKHSFDPSMPELRPLKEYVQLQRQRQLGNYPLSGSVVVAREFARGEKDLTEISKDFLAEAKVPVAFLEVKTLLSMITDLTKDPSIRTAINWSRVFTRGGLSSERLFREELAAAKEQRYDRHVPLGALARVKAKIRWLGDR